MNRALRRRSKRLASADRTAPMFTFNLREHMAAMAASAAPGWHAGSWIMNHEWYALAYEACATGEPNPGRLCGLLVMVDDHYGFPALNTYRVRRPVARV